MGAFQAKIQHLTKQHSQLANECSELRLKVEAAEKKKYEWTEFISVLISLFEKTKTS